MKQYLITNPLYSVFCPLSSVLGPLLLSRTLYKSAHFIQNKPNSLNVQIYINVYAPKIYKNKTASGPGKNKPNQTQFLERMNVSFYAAMYYDSKPAFAVCKGRPNSQDAEFTTAGSFRASPSPSLMGWARFIAPGG